MLRRCISLPSTVSGRMMALAVNSSSSSSARFLASYTPLRLQANNNNSNNKAASEEDREELERERRLREQFAQKIQGQPAGFSFNQQQSYGRCGPNGQCGPSGQPFGGPGGMMGGGMFRLSRFFFFLSAMLLIFLMAQMANPNAPFRLMQSIPWWQLPITSASYYLLLMALLPRQQQELIKEEYQQATRMQPQLTFDQFMRQRYPNVFDGYKTSQNELVAAVSACLATATDLRFANIVSRAAGRARDIRASSDSIMEALHREYPAIFAPR